LQQDIAGGAEAHGALAMLAMCIRVNLRDQLRYHAGPNH
jgi:hypothetical protein